MNEPRTEAGRQARLDDTADLDVILAIEAEAASDTTPRGAERGAAGAGDDAGSRSAPTATTTSRVPRRASGAVLRPSKPSKPSLGSPPTPQHPRRRRSRERARVVTHRHTADCYGEIDGRLMCGGVELIGGPAYRDLERHVPDEDVRRAIDDDGNPRLFAIHWIVGAIVFGAILVAVLVLVAGRPHS